MEACSTEVCVHNPHTWEAELGEVGLSHTGIYTGVLYHLAALLQLD